MTRRAPVIGVTLDQEVGNIEKYSAFPWYALRQNYGDSIAEAGGLPLMLPHHAEAAEAYLDRIDGLMVTGGHFDVDPALFGAAATHESVTTKPRRTQFEWAIMQGALARHMPILGICGGEQLLNVVLGGTLIQHIPESFPNALVHEQPPPKDEPTHLVSVVEGSLLHRITGAREFKVNSTHHQAVATPGKGVLVNAQAPDGVIEGIELPGHPFCLGVEWHPEYGKSPENAAIMKAFVEAARIYGN